MNFKAVKVCKITGNKDAITAVETVTGELELILWNESSILMLPVEVFNDENQQRRARGQIEIKPLTHKI